MHFHAYLYRGPGEAIKPFDDARRPGTPEFQTAVVPPEATSAWLSKPARMVKGTWDDPGEAVTWLARQYTDVADQRMHLDRQLQAPSLETMTANALDTLRRGNDVVWAWWLRGGNFIDLTVACCPNRDAEHPCPEGRNDRRPDRVT
ncbi:hypothetical protein [Actinoallomurus rhizosphaericola]|uniref:hypothetical protein n=1 Tax=Actinoallomurus rhizosphaericola TaxID=2952536 RepID=UPI00209194C4|nr:hypothetical protein [Actinoallomurus rhizosphaericola]MCO5994277.1 hypothetical protein [Actinoallomurus rhizosphaericola]